MTDDLIGLLQDAIGRDRYPITAADNTWTCASCERILALIDKSDRVIRRKTSDGPIYVNLGRDGRMSLGCPGCGAANVIEADPTTPTGFR